MQVAAAASWVYNAKAGQKKKPVVAHGKMDS